MNAAPPDTPPGAPETPAPLAAPAGNTSAAGRTGFHLFLIGFLVLFLELACIRWFAAYVIFLQFFTNAVLIACFLGMSCGCLAAKRKRDWLASFPLLGLLTFAAAVGSLFLYRHWEGLAVNLGRQSSMQQVFFGTEYRNPDVAQFVVPLEFVVAAFFALIAFLFVGLGQALGRAFDAYPNRVAGYALNIGGSLTGIVAFSALSLAHAPPPVWFAIALPGVAYLLRRSGRLNWIRGILLALLLGVTAIPPINPFAGDNEVRWSPYYAVVRTGREISVNTISHQTIAPFDRWGSVYSLAYLLQKHAGGKPFEDVLVIGAGSGNDLVHALRNGAKHIDAVEIDPAIQRMGVRSHPDHPYQDPRVTVHLDDGRHFLRTTDRKYDLVVYALVDSLILHSSFASVRLESFLFTEQAFKDIRRVLKPDGVFVAYNWFRKGWIVQRIAAMAQDAFGQPPLVFCLPPRKTLEAQDEAEYWIVLLAGDIARITEAFARNGSFQLHRLPTRNQQVDGFATKWTRGRGAWDEVTPTQLVADAAVPLSTPTDDWPFLYSYRRTVPMLNLRLMLLMGAISAAMVWLFTPPGRARGGWRMFFLGAGFLLLETKAVVHMALLFGGTWLVNSLVFFSVLIMILLANLYVLKSAGARLRWHYAGLFALLAANMLIPLDVFLNGGVMWRYALPCALVLGPMFFAGVIFARSFRDSADPDRAFGANIAGSALGGLSESFSTVLGFRYLLLPAILFYGLSIIRPRKA